MSNGESYNAVWLGIYNRQNKYEDMLKQSDLDIISDALAKGYDVRIQTTKSGYRILADRVTVLKKEDIETAVKMDGRDARGVTRR